MALYVQSRQKYIYIIRYLMSDACQKYSDFNHNYEMKV